MPKRKKRRQPYRVARTHLVPGMLFTLYRHELPEFIVTRARGGTHHPYVKYRKLRDPFEHIRGRREYSMSIGRGNLSRYMTVYVWDDLPVKS